MNKKATLMVACLLCTGLFTVGTLQALELADLPSAVQKTVKRELGSAYIDEIKRDTEDGKVVYDIEAEATDGREIELKVAEDGRLLEKGEEVRLAEVPAAVGATIERELGSVKPDKIKRQTEDGAIRYEVDAETADGREIDLEVAEDGTLLDKKEVKEADDDEGVAVENDSQSAIAAGTALESARHTIVHGGPHIFCGHPASNGIWSWDNEIIVGFSEGKFVEKEGHNIDKNSTRNMLARSLDGGETWKIEDPENYVGDGGETTGPPGGINFAHTDFAMRINKEPEQFFYSYDCGHTWKGPHNFGDLMSQPGLAGKKFTARTDYLVNGPDDCLVFLSAEPGVSGRDFTFTARTTDGGKTFKFVSWIVPPTDPHRGVMPSTVRYSDTKLVTAVRRRQGHGETCWIDTYVSQDNGNSWSFQSKVGDAGQRNGNPPAMVRMKDGRFCCVYGYRTRKMLVARYSRDQGVT